MHVWTHLSPKWQDKSGFGLYADGMMELDGKSVNCLRRLTTSSSPTTPSCCSPAIMAPKSLHGRIAATTHSGRHLRGWIPRANVTEVARASSSLTPSSTTSWQAGLASNTARRCR
jgi:hypothetical protein